jgi:hypothetical protein
VKHCSVDPESNCDDSFYIIMENFEELMEKLKKIDERKIRRNDF